MAFFTKSFNESAEPHTKPPAQFFWSGHISSSNFTSLAPYSTSAIRNKSGEESPFGAGGESEETGNEYLFILPFIVLFGLCGNTVSLITIFHSRLRKIAANQYLIVLTVADSVFLFGLTLILFKIDFASYLVCVCVEYVLMTASYVSSWSIAALTLERYLAIAHPLKHVQYSHVNRWKMMFLWVPVPFVLNLIQFITLTPNTDPNDRKCAVIDGRLQMVVEVLDVVLCYLLPCIIVVVMNLTIASKVRSASRSFGKPLPTIKKSSSEFPTPQQQRESVVLNNGVVHKVSICSPIPTSLAESPRHKTSTGSSASRKKNMNRMAGMRNAAGGLPPSSSGSTRILLVVPVVYILLNTPFYLFRMLDTISLNVFQSKAFSLQGGLNGPVIVRLYNFAHYLYYINFACDVVVYAFSSVNFRRTVKIAWCGLLCPAAREKESVNMTNGRFSTNHHHRMGSMAALSAKRLLPAQKHSVEGKGCDGSQPKLMSNIEGNSSSSISG